MAHASRSLDAVELGASYGKNSGAEDFRFATIGATLGIGEAHVGVGYNHVDEDVDGITHVLVLSGDLLLLQGVELQADVSYADPGGEDRDGNLASVLAVELGF